MLVTLNTDASYYPNTGNAGYAFWISCRKGRYKKWGKLKPMKHTSKCYELLSIVNGIYYIINHSELKDNVTKIIVNTDHEPSVLMFNEPTLHFTRPVKHKFQIHIRKMVFNWLRDIELEMRHIHSHKKITNARGWVNSWCDKHAKKGAKL